MGLPAIHRTHSVRNWVHLDGIDGNDLPAVLSMARDDWAANSAPGPQPPFSPVVGLKDGRPALIWHHTRTSGTAATFGPDTTLTFRMKDPNLDPHLQRIIDKHTRGQSRG